MEDISELPDWNAEELLGLLKANPLTIKALKTKLDKIYMITSYNEQEYLKDVIEAYAWIRLANELPAIEPMFEHDRVMRYFLQDFVHTAVRYMVLCKKFKMIEMMAMTQQMMVESLKLFMKYFKELEKYPKMTLILKHVFDIEKPFYKLNYVNEYPYLVVPPTKQQISQIDHFIDNLQVGDKVDVLKNEMQSKRLCWLPGVVKKVTTINVYVHCVNEKGNLSFDRKSMQVRPFESQKHMYEWRYSLKAGDQIDIFNENYTWAHGTVAEIKEPAVDSEDEGQNQIEVKIQGEDRWLGLTDAKIQKFNSVVQEGAANRYSSDIFVDDFNDVLFDPEMTCFCVARPEATKSQMFIDLMNYAHKELHLFDKISQAIKEKQMKIQATADLINFVLIVQSMFHRKFAIQYLGDLTESILDYINNSKESTIRNFSKERYDAVYSALNEFLKRLKPVSERKEIIEKVQMDLILRFFFSDFLDRKLQAITLLANFFKLAKHSITRKSLKQFVDWIESNKILTAIYNEKSHSELISRSSDFLKYYLETNPSAEKLEPLLIWNDAIIKLVDDYFAYLPEQICNKVVEKIKEKANVTNLQALSIIKKTPNCENWLLQNGGECWVEVVKDKQKKKAYIAEVFKHPFKVVHKITKEVFDLYDCTLKTSYFNYLFESNYLCEVLSDSTVSYNNKIEFASLTLDLIKTISDDIFVALLPFMCTVKDSICKEYQDFFISLLGKLQNTHIKKLFAEKFSDLSKLSIIGELDFKIFQKCFLFINEDARHIEKIIKYEYPTPHAFRKEKRETLVIKRNPNDLLGMDGLLLIVFQNKNISVTMTAIEFIGFLFNHLTQELKPSIVEFKKNFLDNCLNQLYKVSESEENGDKAVLQEKYLKILEQIMSEAEQNGVDETPSVNALFPPQKISLRVIDYFNVNKSRIFLEVPSNLTLHELRYEIGKHINAYPHEMKIVSNGKQLDNRFNGQVLHALKLNGDLLIEKKGEITRVSLIEGEGQLVAKAKIIFKNIFKEYSSFGLMSKKQCQKYHQKCVGDITSMGEAKVQKIYEQYDSNHDGYLSEEDFLNFYETSARNKESAVWSNLETFGIRNDLEVLSELECVYADKNTLTRYLLFENEKFMKILFSLLASQNLQLAEAAWNMAGRLPLYLNFPYEAEVNKQFQTRYWLYIVDHNSQYEKMDKQILKAVLKMSVETACMGLKVANQCKLVDIQIFQIVLDNLKTINSQEDIDFLNKVVLDNSLQILNKSLGLDETIKQYYLEHQSVCNKIFREGIMSANSTSRAMYCKGLEEIIEHSIEADFRIFEALFNLVYKIFDNCDKSTLTIEYFDLFSSLLEMLCIHDSLMEKLNLNWSILTHSIIELYQTHECTETSMNSKSDQVAQGLLRIISKLLNHETIESIQELVPFIFQQSLFPENGRNKLKNSKSRQDAYQLIYDICKYQKANGTLSEGLQKLFDAGFKKIYKKMSTKKAADTVSYYYYSYNEARSELGYSGLRNLGCICYMISMIQQLYMTAPFRNLIMMADDKEPECLVKRGSKEVDDNLFHQFQNMFAHLQLTEKQDYNPDDFCFAFKDFDGLPMNVSVQQDAQEFLNIFFDKMETSLKNTPFCKIFQNIFGGRTCSQMKCSGCGAVKERFQNFYPLSLEIKGFKNINDSLKKYIQGEVISDYQCDGCSQKCDVTKRSFLEKTPNYFIIHLQRMCFDYDKFENVKVNSRWEFPNDLNVYEFTTAHEKGMPQENEEFTYKLKGVVIHYGTADFGHYFSYIKESDNQWIEFNDERVREFDPNDIEAQCFGGEHWRRESQSAYLLVYEREKKSNLTLQFSSEEEKNKVLMECKLFNTVVESDCSNSQVKEREEKQVMEEKEPQTEGEKVSSQVSSEMSSQVEKVPSEEKEGKEDKEGKKILVNLDMRKIMQFVPKPVKEKIDKENDEFSFTMNLSNDEFVLFIYHVLSIDPPENLKSEYLELCYECFHLKQMLVDEEEKSINIAEWAATRFRELIDGHGWEFLKNFGQNWDADILSIEKSTRSVIKSLLDCVVSDIIKSASLNQELEETQINEAMKEKREIVYAFLEKMSDMMLGEVAKHWPRFKEYFNLWVSLVRNNEFVRRYCEEKMLIEKILDFVMDTGYPYPRAYKRYPMGNQYYSAEFEYPLELMHVLISLGYELNEMEEKCRKTYAFMDKIIAHRVAGANMIEELCKGNHILSEKMGYLLLNKCAAVNQSDQVKPIVASIHEFLRVNDDLAKLRVEWILGFPYYIEHERSGSFGSYGIHPDTDPILNYVSALGLPSVLQLITKFKAKTQHVAALLISMVLQLESDGLINNLDELPSRNALDICFTSWFEPFVNNYYDETHRAFTAKNYVEYGDRIKMLWTERPNRPLTVMYPRILIGKSIESQPVKSETVLDIFDITQTDIKSYYLPLNEETRGLTGKNIKTCKAADRFVSPNLPRQVTAYGHHNSLMKLQSSDEEDTEENPNEAVFDKTQEGLLLRKIKIMNNSTDNMLVVLKVGAEDCNLHVPKSPMSAEIKAESFETFTLIKKDIGAEFGQLEIKLSVLGTATRSGYWPRQILTEGEPKVEDDDNKASSDEQDDIDAWH